MQESYEEVFSYIPTSMSLITSSVLGYFVGGVPYAVTLTAATALDEFLLYSNITDKHYIALTSFWYTAGTRKATIITNKLFKAESNSAVVDIGGKALSVIAATAISHVMQDFLDYKDALAIPFYSYRLISNIFKDTSLHSLLIKSHGLEWLNIGCDQLFLHYFGSYATNTQYLRELTQGLSRQNLYSMYVTGAKITVAFASYQGVKFAIDLQKHALQKELFSIIATGSASLLVEEGQKIKASPKGPELVKSLVLDLWSVTNTASSIQDVMSSTTEGLLAIKNLYKFGPSVIACYMPWIIARQLYFSNIIDDRIDLQEDVYSLGTRIHTLQTDIATNIDKIVLRDAQNYMNKNLDELLSQKHAKVTKMELWDKLSDQIVEWLANARAFIDLLYYGTNIVEEHFKLTQYAIFQKSLKDLYSFSAYNLGFKWGKKNAVLALDRVEELYNIISTTKKISANHFFHDKNNIVYEDYKLYLGEKLIVSIPYLELLGGYVYAVTGKSGCGKTTTLIDTKQGVMLPFQSFGSIGLPVDAKIMFIDQQLYIPVEATLFELCLFPKSALTINEVDRNLIKSRVKDLFAEIKIDSIDTMLIDKLDNQEFGLSGGQAKKIAIIQAILNEPNILIMDETFTGLDQSSLLLAQQMLKKYLPDTTILIVDHHAKDNNYNHFYHKELHFENAAVEVLDIEDKMLNTSSQEQEAQWSPLYVTSPSYSNNTILMCDYYGHYDWHEFNIP